MLTITAKPYDYTFSPAKVALVLIDMQRDFIEPGGFGETLGNNVGLLNAIVPAVKRLLEAFREHKLMIVHTKEGHKPDLSDCPPAKLTRGKGTLKIGDVGPMGRVLILGEPGNDFIPELAPKPGEIVLSKPGKGAFYATGLDQILQSAGVTHLIVGGVTTEVCVQTTLREANDRGYECLLVEDATESYFPEYKKAVIEMVRAQGGIVGWTSNSDRVISALEGAREPIKEPASPVSNTA